jgi:hypothetical protein
MAAQLKRKATAKNSDAMLELMPELSEFFVVKEEPVKRQKVTIVASSPSTDASFSPTEKLMKNTEELYSVAHNKKVRIFMSKGGEPRIEIRKLDDDGNATDVNIIVLNLSQVRVLLQAAEKINVALTDLTTEGKTDFTPNNLGKDVILSISDRFISVDIRKFFSPISKEGVSSQAQRPTRLGVSFTRGEWGALRNILNEKVGWIINQFDLFTAVTIK